MSINLIGLLLVSLYNEHLDRISLLTILGIMLIIYISNLILSKITTGDHYILLIVSMLMSIGIIMIHRINPCLLYTSYPHRGRSNEANP